MAVKYARRVDSNHAELVRVARQVGAAVLDVHAVPGALDLVVGYRGVLYLLEIKDGAKVKSARALTPAEEKTIAEFERVSCPVHVVESVDDMLRVIGAIR